MITLCKELTYNKANIIVLTSPIYRYSMGLNLKDTIIVDEIISRIHIDRGNIKFDDSGIAYIVVNIVDLDISKSLEDYIWNMPEFYGITSYWCDIKSKCRPHTIYFTIRR